MTMLETLNNSRVKVFTDRQIDGERSFRLGNFLAAMKYKGDIYTPFNNSIILFLDDGRLRTSRSLLQEHAEFSKSIEQESDESKGRCKFCMKNVIFTKKMVSIFVEATKKIYLKSEDREISDNITQFYVNICNNCGDMEPWKLNKDQLLKMKALASKIKDDSGKTLKVTNPKNSVNADRLLEVIKRGILVKRSK